MGMRIGGENSSTSSVNEWKERRQAMTNLTSALQSGNLNVAKEAYSSLTSNSVPPANSPLAKLGTAIQSGNVTVAQQALEALKSAKQNYRQQDNSQTNLPSIKLDPTATVGSKINTFA